MSGLATWNATVSPPLPHLVLWGVPVLTVGFWELSLPFHSSASRTLNFWGWIILCVCVCVQACVHMYMCVCVCVCVW
jgi:hypothetical protein